MHEQTVSDEERTARLQPLAKLYADRIPDEDIRTYAELQHGPRDPVIEAFTRAINGDGSAFPLPYGCDESNYSCGLFGIDKFHIETMIMCCFITIEDDMVKRYTLDFTATTALCTLCRLLMERGDIAEITTALSWIQSVRPAVAEDVKTSWEFYESPLACYMDTTFAILSLYGSMLLAQRASEHAKLVAKHYDLESYRITNLPYEDEERSAAWDEVAGRLSESGAFDIQRVLETLIKL